MLRIGLTGGIGSGKSTVAGLLERLGAAIIDTDEIAHALTRPGGAAIEPIRSAFGAEAIRVDGALDRAKMRALVFADLDAKRRLEAILHPLIRAEATARGQRQAQRAPYLVYVVPLLVESGSWTSQIDRVLVVDVPRQVQIERVAASRPLREKEIERIAAQQAGRVERLSAADDVLFNDLPLQALPPRVQRLHEFYLQLGRARHCAIPQA